MSATTTVSPLSALRAAEAAAVAQINAAAEAISRIGTNSIAAATARLKAEIEAAAGRIGSAIIESAVDIDMLVQTITDIVGGDAFGLTEAEMPTTEPAPAPVTLPEPIAARMSAPLPEAVSESIPPQTVAIPTQIEDDIDLANPPTEPVVQATEGGESPTAEEPTPKPSRNGKARTTRKK